MQAPAASSPPGSLPGHPSFRDRVREEWRANVAFKLACIGGALIVLAAVLQLILFALGRHPGLSPGFILFHSLFTIGMAVLMIYMNYCYVHGKCNTLALVFGILYVIVGVISVLAVTALLATGAGRSPPPPAPPASSRRR